MSDSTPIFSLDDLDFDLLRDIWTGTDPNEVGRFLRAHLVVEHFLTERLASRNPQLQNLEAVRLSFHAKMQLLGNVGIMALVGPGIRQLNVIRNRVAHRLSYRVTPEDVTPLFEPGDYFQSYLDTRARIREIQATTPIDVVEAFGEWAAMWLHTDDRLAVRMKHLEQELAEANERLAEQRGRLEGEGSVLAEWRTSLEDAESGEP